jgi:hypothetical protein
MYWSEDTFLGEALTVRATAILGLIEARATNLNSHVSGKRQVTSHVLKHTLRRLQ